MSVAAPEKAGAARPSAGRFGKGNSIWAASRSKPVPQGQTFQAGGEAMATNATEFFDWAAWSRSAKGNSWMQRELCKVTIFENRYTLPSREGWCWSVYWEDRTEPVYSADAYETREEARAAAWQDEIVPGETAALAIAATARKAAEKAWPAFEGLTAAEREAVVQTLRRWSNDLAGEERAKREHDEFHAKVVAAEQERRVVAAVEAGDDDAVPDAPPSLAPPLTDEEIAAELAKEPDSVITDQGIR
jgi:hypothetical protein